MPNKQIKQQARAQRPQTEWGSSFAVCQTSNRILFVAFVAFAVMMLSPIQVVAQQTWSLNKLNPLNILPKSDMRMPEWPKWATVKIPEVSLVPAWIEIPKPADIPVGLSELHRSTTRGINKTINFLNPFYDKPTPLVHRPPTGTRNAAGETKSTAPSSFWFSSFTAEEESTSPSRTVHDFLGRPRLGR